MPIRETHKIDGNLNLRFLRLNQVAMKYTVSTSENNSLLGIGALICLIISALTVAPTLKFGFPRTGLIAFVPLLLSFPVYLINFRWCRMGSIATWVVTCCTSITGAVAGVLGMEIIPIAFLVIAASIASFVDLKSKSATRL
jgi:hypothetical protein